MQDTVFGNGVTGRGVAEVVVSKTAMPPQAESTKDASASRVKRDFISYNFV